MLPFAYYKNILESRITQKAHDYFCKSRPDQFFLREITLKCSHLYCEQGNVYLTRKTLMIKLGTFTLAKRIKVTLEVAGSFNSNLL